MRTNLAVEATLAALVAIIINIPSTLSAADKGPSAPTVTSAEAWRIGWPSLAGPKGNFGSLRTGVPVVEDLNQATVAWKSEPLFGDSKMGSKGWIDAKACLSHLGVDAVKCPSSWTGPIVAENRVYMATFRPTKTLYSIKSGNSGPEVIWKSDTPVMLRLEMEDLVVALDAQTGKTLWLTTHSNAVIQTAGKRNGFQVTPAYGHGRLYSLGSAWIARAHDGATGTLVWETDYGPLTEKKRKQREAYLALGKEGIFDPVESDGPETSIVIAGDTVVYPDGTGKGLIGLDSATGTRKWAVANCMPACTPTVWRHKEKAYVLTCYESVLRMIDAADGRECWRTNGFGSTCTTMSISDDILVLNVKPTPKIKGQRTAGVYGAVRISLTGCEPVWSMPDVPGNSISTWLDNCGRQRVVIRDGIAYFDTIFFSNDPAVPRVPDRFHAIELATGKELATHANEGHSVNKLGGGFYAVEDYLLCRFDNNHGPRHGGRHPFVMWRQEETGFRRFDELGLPCNMDLVEFASGYTTDTETPVVDGRLFDRANTGEIVCLDLRKKPMAATWELELSPSCIGLSRLTMPVRLWEGTDGLIRQGRCRPPTSTEAGAIMGTLRTFCRWEALWFAPVKPEAGVLKADIPMNSGSIQMPCELNMQAGKDGVVSGTWIRRVPAQNEIVLKGEVDGHAPQAKRFYPAPWQKDNPMPEYGKNPPGTTTTVINLKRNHEANDNTLENRKLSAMNERRAGRS